MLYNLDWLKPGEVFPPKCESTRIKQYEQNAKLFDMITSENLNRLDSKLQANFDIEIDFDSILNYQRLVTIKLADMVVGAFPSITAKEDALTDEIQQIRDTINFDSKAQSAVIDFSRFGVTVFRLYLSEETDSGDFTCWDPSQWFPIIRNDGTKRIKEHVLAWRTNIGTCDNPIYQLSVQRHPIEGGYYIVETYKMDDQGTHIDIPITSKKISTGDLPCLIQYAANIPTTTNIYGTSDYMIFNTLVNAATKRIRQILDILDKHADPSMTGSDSLLTVDENGEKVLKVRRFYALGEGEQKPEYITWDGELDAAFTALNFLVDQLYILSEMGDAFLGGSSKSGQAISGTAMRFKMASPLTKARRVANALTLPIKKLMSTLLKYEDKDVRYQDLSIKWEDSLPKDPREQAELVRLQTGENAIMPLKTAIMEQYDMSSEDAEEWIALIDSRKPEDNDTTPNPLKKGSTQSIVAGAEGSTGTKNKKSSRFSQP